ncbi:Basic leucine zipper 43 [Rhynchospora pubera]|uniref:Basic leucine zipper 43 n=1 Tax=Rhynchospora pubera TaxID=906938 RepID=A0AAV8GKC8_9POAL|nr:Basic leucine zipper 43 [Rhynchospora pubera]KAJ4781115.1 Basic leucine zipper 43 [Rhynchospora pubera]KAJ4804351.1 Basic leucine zipper 43 [Rhynchospora pubera]
MNSDISSPDLPFLLDPDFQSGLGFSDNSLSDPTDLEPVYQTKPLSVAEQRRLRRKISNRESARRSRARKQHHIEGLRARLARLQAEKQNLSNQLGTVLSRSELVRCQNFRLQAESVMLRRRLAEARRVLILRQLQQLVVSPCSGFGPGSGSLFGFEQALASLIS